MKISVIIPVFNGEKYVAQCIENILHQTCKNLEIIVIDDGSTDNSAAIAGQYPVLVIRQENQGLSASRNRGIEAATGEYIHFMDVDDWINLDYYTRMAEAIALTGADMACSGMISEIKTYQTLLYSDRLLPTTIDDKFSVTNVGQLGYCWRYLFKKSFLDEKKLRFEVGRLMEDLPFSLQAVYWANKIVTVPSAVYYYKKREGSIMTTNDRAAKNKRREHWAITKAFRDEFKRQHNLKDFIVLVQKYQYKILGIPMLKKIVYNNGKTRWYLFGIYILQQKYLDA
jgi:glycosyltransferase involved in cell wall biosynthesis